MNSKTASMPVGIVVRRKPGATRWARWEWRAVAVIPGAPPAQWSELRRQGDTIDFHAGTLPLTLHRAETEAYLTGLSVPEPKVYVIMRKPVQPDESEPLDLVVVTASPYEAQDYTDNGEDIVEPVVIPRTLAAWIAKFVEDHHQDEIFIKRKRDKSRVDLVADGIGDPRIRQIADVYRAPGSQSKEGAG